MEAAMDDASDAEAERGTEPVTRWPIPPAEGWTADDLDQGLPVVYVYELDPATATYALSGIFHDRLKLTVPFDIEIDLTAIDRRPGR
ncbi:hypothetical protein [Streptomyces sp. NPDC006012]|uniref:hypothetical protein n=1 Tax=Streptomyces sp. NPDC006012 TaxID=3364739 RepID=UPI0036B3545A